MFFFFFFNNKTKNYNCLLSPQKTGERKLTSFCVVYTRVPICYLKELLNHFVHTVVDSHLLILIICASFLCSCWCHIVSNWYSLHAAGTRFSSLHECYTWKLTWSINAWYFSHVKGSQSRWNALYFTVLYSVREWWMMPPLLCFSMQSNHLMSASICLQH